MLETIDEFIERGVGFRSLTEHLSTEGPVGRAMVTLMAVLAPARTRHAPRGLSEDLTD